jgi:hypothetical protein
MERIIYFDNVPSKNWNNTAITLNGNFFNSYEFFQYLNILKPSELINKSFMIRENNEILSQTPFIIFKRENTYEASFIGGPLNFSLFKKEMPVEKLKEIITEIFENIDKICLKNNVKNLFIRIPNFFFVMIDNFENDILNSRNFFKDRHSKSFSMRSNCELILNLTDEIKLRKRHTSYLNYTRQKTTIKILDSKNFDETLFEKYCIFHNSNKKNKRSIENFKFNKKLILNNFQTIFLCLLGTEIINSIVILNFNKKIIYNSSVNKFVDKKIYGNFILINEAINYFKKKEYQQFSLGEVVDIKNSDLSNYSKKEINISKFKNNWVGKLKNFNNFHKKLF